MTTATSSEGKSAWQLFCSTLIYQHSSTWREELVSRWARRSGPALELFLVSMPLVKPVDDTSTSVRTILTDIGQQYRKSVSDWTRHLFLTTGSCDQGIDFTSAVFPEIIITYYWYVRVSQQLDNKQQVIASLRHELTAREELLRGAQHQLQSATSAQVCLTPPVLGRWRFC